MLAVWVETMNRDWRIRRRRGRRTTPDAENAGRRGSRPRSRSWSRSPSTRCCPNRCVIGPRFLIPGLELALLVALIATNPLRMTRQTRWSRRASLALAVLVVTTNLVTLGLLVDGPGPAPGHRRAPAC